MCHWTPNVIGIVFFWAACVTDLNNISLVHSPSLKFTITFLGHQIKLNLFENCTEKKWATTSKVKWKKVNVPSQYLHMLSSLPARKWCKFKFTSEFSLIKKTWTISEIIITFKVSYIMFFIKTKITEWSLKINIINYQSSLDLNLLTKFLLSWWLSRTISELLLKSNCHM